MARILVCSNGVINHKMGGDGIRYQEIATQLAKENDVYLAAPGASIWDKKDIKINFIRYKRQRDLKNILNEIDIIIAQKLHPILLEAVRKKKNLLYR
ncbi:MAG: hypothetical protein V1872_01865 [bacterium]